MRHFFHAAMAFCGLVLLVEGCSQTAPSKPLDKQATADDDHPPLPRKRERPEQEAEKILTVTGDHDSFHKRPNDSVSEAGNTFVLGSLEVVDGGQLPKDYTGDGTSSTLPLEWSGAPEGTQSFVVIMHHVAPDQIKWYWILYDIPADVKILPKNVRGVGTLGNNSVNGRMEYAPPHSKGPGPKTYIYTIYALTAPPKITIEPSQVSRNVLLAGMKDQILDSAELRVVYTRFPEPGQESDRESDRPPPPREEQQ
jgi:phosphatidylethanolamine-binding protein (PEBP) family uncharacterized protein